MFRKPKGFVVGLTVAAGLALALAGGGASAQPQGAFVQPDLFSEANASPNATFAVIVQGDHALGARGVARDVQAAGNAFGVKRNLATIDGASTELTGKQLVKLARMPGITAITRDVRVRLTAAGLSSTQQWPFVSGVAQGWSSITNGTLPTPPAIAVVDSGIEAARADFSGGARVIKQVNLSTLPNNSPGDGYGHGTFVAGVAAGSASGYSGAAPSAPIVSVDVMDDQGMALTSDVIAACDWILQNKAAYNIRVANLSLHSTSPASVYFDPLDRAVEKLWFSGVVVVAAAGNYGIDGRPSGIPFAPGNDPFVITVGADDVSGSVSTNDDTAAPWSAYGYTLDGFAKPEIGAPGRYMIGPVPAASTLATTRASSVVAPGYIQLSGTSFAAPVIAGTAAYLLAQHPLWTPDQVKGALLVSAKPTPSAAPLSVGVGVLDAARATKVVSPPNANAALAPYVTSDGAGGLAFDAASWGSAAQANASWGSASWGSASWGSASWGSASWGSLFWSAASWGSASWGSASWGSASWGSSALGSLAQADNAGDDDGTPSLMDPLQALEASTELGLTIGPDGSVLP